MEKKKKGSIILSENPKLFGRAAGGPLRVSFIMIKSYFVKQEICFSRVIRQPPPKKSRSEETDVGPAICKCSKDAVSQSAREPFLTAWATLSKCLLHIKGDVAEAVTMMNAFKTSHLRPVASPFHAAKGARDKTRPRSLNFSPRLKSVRAAPSVGRCRTWKLSQQHSRSHCFFFFLPREIHFW